MTTLPPSHIEAEAVDLICHWYDLICAAMTSDAARLILRQHIRERVRQGTLPTMQVIQAARAGHEEADQALRELAVEMLDRGEMPPAALRTYAQEALLTPPVSYPPGRNIVDTWTRDIGVALLVKVTAERWPVPLTRSHISKNPNNLSACYLVSVALGRRGLNLSERRVETIHAARLLIAAKLSASIPSI